LKLSGNAINSVHEFLKKLRKEDIITVTLLSTKAKLNSEIAQSLLTELVNEGVLEYFIIVACSNPETRQFGDVQHYRQFSSLREYNEFSKGSICPLCECGYDYDFKHAKIGFRLKRVEYSYV
jgi:hypothetical protein